MTLPSLTALSLRPARLTVALSAAALAALLTACAAPGGTPAVRHAFVASEAQNQLVVIDLQTEQPIKTLATGQVPHAMATTAQGTIFVNNRGSKNLTLIDGFRLEPLGALDLPATSFQLAVSPDEKTLAVVYRDALKLTLVDTAQRKIIRTIDLDGGTAPAFKGVMMKHPYWSADGRFVYVGDAVNRRIVKVDVAAGRIDKALPIDGLNHYLHPSPDGAWLYAVNESQRGNASLTLIDARTDRVVKELTVALQPGEKALGHHGAFTRDGRHFLYCNEGGRQISVLDVASQTWVKTLATGKGPGHAALSPDGRYFYVVHHNDGVITVIDAQRLEVVRNIGIGTGDKQSHAAWFTPDGQSFYVVAASDKQLVKIDTRRLEVVSRIPVGAQSMFFAVRDGNAFPATEY